MANLISFPEDFTNWANSAPGFTVTSNTTVAPDNTTTADTIADANTTFESAESDTASYTAGTNLVASVFIKKDSTAAATRFPLLRLTFTGGTSKLLDVALDTSTGDTGGGPSSGTLIDSGVIDFDDNYWRLYVAGSDGNNGNTGAKLTVFPSVGANADLSTYSLTATGSIVVWGGYLNTGTSPETYVSQAGITVPIAGLQLVRSVTRGVTRQITRGLSG